MKTVKFSAVISQHTIFSDLNFSSRTYLSAKFYDTFAHIMSRVSDEHRTIQREYQFHAANNNNLNDSCTDITKIIRDPTLNKRK